MFKPQEGQRYDMPAVFGASHLPAVSTIREVRTIALSFVTDEDRLRPLIPYHFDLAPNPVVTLSSGMNIGVDHMGGRSYNVVRVMVDVIAHGEDGPFRAPYHLVIWESEAAPIIAGREFQGYAKVFGQIPDHRNEGDRASFEVSEYGTRLLKGEVSGLVDLPGTELARLNAATQALAVGWKYIPGPNNVADVDYPTKLVAYRTVRAAKRGEGCFELDSPTWQQCPGSARILEALRALPILEMKPALVTVGSAQLPRDEVIRLPARELVVAS